MTADGHPDPLGARYGAFQPSAVWVWAGFLFGLLIIGAGLFLLGFALYGASSQHWDLPFWAKYGWSWSALAITTLLAAVFVYFGWDLVSSSYRNVSSSVELHLNGFRVRSKGKCEDVPWTEVESIQQITRFQRLSVLGGPGGLISSEVAGTSYRVIGRGGKSYDFDGGTIKAIDEFRKILREVAHQKSIRWEKVEERG
jgi:hypothetical protein